MLTPQAGGDIHTTRTYVNSFRFSDLFYRGNLTFSAIGIGDSSLEDSLGAWPDAINDPQDCFRLGKIPLRNFFGS